MQPVVFLHGGPGGGTSPSNRRFFDPEFYRIILFDQVILRAFYINGNNFFIYLLSYLFLTAWCGKEYSPCLLGRQHYMGSNWWHWKAKRTFGNSRMAGIVLFYGLTNFSFELAIFGELSQLFICLLIIQVFGGSWGSTLALVYSQSHPDKVHKLSFIFLVGTLYTCN